MKTDTLDELLLITMDGPDIDKRGFVTFTDVETAEHVLSIESDDLYLDGRYLEVKPATWKKFNRLDEKQENVIKHQMIPAQDDGCICLIDALSDDVMLEVFAFLTLKELLLCERVCRRWKELCSRQLQQMKHLSFNFLKTRFITGFKPRHFDNLLKRVSPTIQSIDLSMMHTCLGNDAVKTIASHCPHLHSLNLSGLMITNSVLQHLANSCQLQSFRVAGGQLEKLSLARCTQLQDSAMSHLLSRCKQLKAINLSYCTQLSVHGIACVSQFHELEVLHISGSHGSVTMLELKHLNKLRELHLADLHLDHVKNLCECIQLKTLKANNLTVNKIGHDLIMEGSLLRVIHLRGCQGLTAADILYIVTVAQDLEELDICYTGLSVAALQIFENLQKSEPERKITLLAYDDTDLDDFTSDDEEDSADLGNAQSYLDGDDPLFAEQFELS
ncbi:hypothetical protein LSH36_15g18019 [Paralvinella palmiformis]|uniref:F-box domain-containing protein n=1 Tax=Paralvinella palmiformis TaxID=53620 RepID=A0AAD9KCA4_9ANNE|nr:hypothetical protein LSH36_15g18019 [Paralvinella palmiformis]